MKKTMMLMAAIMMTTVANAKTVRTTFAVGGGCTHMCKPKIEKAAKSIKGVVSAKWNIKTQQLILVYDDGKANVQTVQKAIASLGYDAGQVRATDKVYNALPGCCKYKRVK